jgi:hypothetical protein
LRIVTSPAAVWHYISIKWAVILLLKFRRAKQLHKHGPFNVTLLPCVLSVCKLFRPCVNELESRKIRRRQNNTSYSKFIILGDVLTEGDK